MIDFSVYKNLFFHLYDFLEVDQDNNQRQHSGYYEIYNLDENENKTTLYHVFAQSRGVPSSLPDINNFASSDVSISDINNVLTRILSINNNVDISNLDVITDNSLLYEPSSLLSDTRETIQRNVSGSYIVTYQQSTIDKKVPLVFVPYNLYELPLDDTNVYQTLNGLLQTPSPTMSDDEYKIYKLVEDYNKNYILYHSHFDNNVDGSSDSSSSVDLSTINTQLTNISNKLSADVLVDDNPEPENVSITQAVVNLSEQIQESNERPVVINNENLDPWSNA